MRTASLLLVILVHVSALVPAQEATPRRASARLPSRRTSPLLTTEVLNGFFRPTVTIRKGNGRGSGTLIRSEAGATLILTAAHVVAVPGDMEIELHPYNLGIEKNERALAGTSWPRLVPAEIVAADNAADVALVLMHARTALPFVARLDLEANEPAPADILTSVGLVSGTDLTGWRTDIQGQVRIDLATFTHRGSPGDPRVFTVTTKAPEFGRSGGGLFRPDGSLVGVAVGRLKLNSLPEVGVFASMQSIRRLVRANHLEQTVGTARP